jgi:hypothetical protein
MSIRAAEGDYLKSLMAKVAYATDSNMLHLHSEISNTDTYGLSGAEMVWEPGPEFVADFVLFQDSRRLRLCKRHESVCCSPN